MAAAKHGHKSTVELLANAGADLDTRDEFGRTLLEAAASSKNATLVRWVLDQTSTVTTEPERHRSWLDRFFGSDDASDAQPETQDLIRTRALLDAAASGDLATVEVLLGAGGDATYVGTCNSGAAHAAVIGGNPAVLRRLLEAGAKPDLVDCNGQSPIGVAVQEGSPEDDPGLYPMAIELARHGTEPIGPKDAPANTHKPVYTPLHWAAETNNVEATKTFIRWFPKLIDAGYRRRPNRKKIHTPLHLAARAGHAEIITVLAAAGAKLDLVNDSWNGRTALHLAQVAGHGNAVSVLIEAGARHSAGSILLWAARNNKVEVLSTLAANGIDLNAPIDYKDNALHVAAKSGHLPVVTALLDAGVDINARASGNLTALDYALSHGDVDVLVALIKAGADVTRPNGTKRIHLADAAARGSVLIVQALLEAGANPEEPSAWNSTPLEQAAKHNRTETAKVLLAAGADPDALGKHGHTPLLVASKAGNFAVVEALLKGGADPNVASDYGRLPLHYAAIEGHPTIARALLAAGAETERTADTSGYTALALAAERGHTKVIEALLAANADQSIKVGYFDSTPLELARQKGHSSAIAVLEAAAKRKTQ